MLRILASINTIAYFVLLLCTFPHESSGIKEHVITADYPCNIKRITLVDDHTGLELAIAELPDEPVIFQGLVDRNAQLARLCTKDALSAEPAGSTIVKLTSSNTYSHGDKKMKLRDYLEYTTSPNTYRQAPAGQEINGDSISSSTETTSATATATAAASSLLSNETFYFFGGNMGTFWEPITAAYNMPPWEHSPVAGSRTLGIAGAHSGVSFHLHGPGFSESILGRKRWFLLPPEGVNRGFRGFHDHIEQGKGRGGSVPGIFGLGGKRSLTDLLRDVQFDPNMTVYQWVEKVYPSLIDPPGNNITSARLEIDATGDTSASTAASAAGADQQSPQHESASHVRPYSSGLQECVIGLGDMLYFPSYWLHATLNVDEYNVFMSVFVDTQLIPRAKAPS